MSEMMLFVVTTLVICMVVLHWTNLRLHALDQRQENRLVTHDNSGVPLLKPPAEVDINENELSCHDIPTPCASNADCQLCSESLASCQRFEETVVLQLDDNRELTVNPGESYCLALDNRSARSCNPNTGTWVMRRVDSNNYALICHCDVPGLVTQLNIYEDCTVPVGCAPHGVIADVYASPLRCLCDDGFVSEISDTGTPYCRPMVMRDVVLRPEFYHRPPCRDGFLPAEHPAFDVVYRRQIGANVCLPDPCSIDPLTGERHEGRVVYEVDGGADGGPLITCRCPVDQNLYPVYNVSSMLNTRYTETDSQVANVCVKPLKVDRRDVRSDLKVFWGRNSLRSDADIVFQVNEDQVSEPYRVLLQRRISDHPTASVTTGMVLKFQIDTAFVKSSVNSTQRDVYQGYIDLNYLRTHVNTCPLPGIGECTNPLVCGNINCSYNACIRNVYSSGYANRCFFFRVNRTFDDLGSVGLICVWNTPQYYAQGGVPVTFFVNALCATDGGYGVANDVRTLYFTDSGKTVGESQYGNLVQLLATYPYYNS
ncbi:pif-1 [Clostera anastomosis granulovirus A]|uniref:Pif-1 n=1 Tax=Clostera anastomosis granulovirus A TaxID=1986289 RepID=U5KAU1_9BBAC|nr:pif-1 [Clostera anastomosis granulovirus Henan]AGQ20322.1 pif-1 [Clostera anastomosis granulovirus Henan]